MFIFQLFGFRSSLEHIVCSQDFEHDTNSDFDNDTSSFLANERMTNVNWEEIKHDNAGLTENKNTEISKEATNTSNMLDRYLDYPTSILNSVQ